MKHLVIGLVLLGMFPVAQATEEDLQALKGLMEVRNRHIVASYPEELAGALMAKFPVGTEVSNAAVELVREHSAYELERMYRSALMAWSARKNMSEK